jgi:RimJ/RimL family protein N-acetyltransferase
MASNTQPFELFNEIHSLAEHVFESKRLVYRAMEDTEEDRKFFHDAIQQDPTNFAFSDFALFKPQSRASSDGTLKIIVEKSLILVMVCLPPAKDEIEQTTQISDQGDDVKSEKKQQEKQDPPKPTPIGFVGLSASGKLTSHHRNAGLAISFSKKYQGHGYGTEALEWILEWSFNYGNLHRIELSCFAFNEAGRKAYERAGFVLEGTKRESLYLNRRYWDIADYGILESDWLRHKSQK